MSRADNTAASAPMAAGPRTPRPDLPLAMALLLALSLASAAATADRFAYFPDGPDTTQFEDLQPTLEDLGVHQEEFETDGQSFIVPDANGDGSPVSITASLLQDTGNYRFTFGAFPVEAVAGMDAPQDRFGWTTAALTHPQTMVVFDDRDIDPCSDIANLDASCQRSFPGIPVGSEWFFFLIPNNTLEAYQSDPEGFYNGTLCSYAPYCSKPLFSYTPANPGSFDQMLSFIGNGETLFSFEDITRTLPNSDQDFSDLVFLLDFDGSDATFTADDSQETRGAANVPTPSSLWLMLIGLLAAASLGLGQGARRR